MHKFSFAENSCQTLPLPTTSIPPLPSGRVSKKPKYLKKK